MNDFEYDVKQKKNLARNAQYKKNGSKSKKCALPHETLTKKELAALSGPCTTYNLARPMTYEKFKELPNDLKSEYLRKLDARFHVSVRALTEMFGCCFQTAYNAFDAAGIHHSKGHRMSAEDVKAWKFWLSDVPDKKNIGEETEMNEAKCEEPIDLAAELKAVEEPTTEEKATPLLRNGKLHYEGAARRVATDILAFLSQFDSNCHVELKFNFGE